MTYDDVLIRAGDSGPADVDSLIHQRRLVEVVFRGEVKLSAVEDMARLRDGLGVQPPDGVPLAFLEPVPDPLGDVVGRYARTHTPFSVDEAASSLGLPVAVVETVLESLEASGRVTRGAFLRGGRSQEWVDTGVLRRLKRRSLANLREEIEPVDQHRLAWFSIEWHGISSRPPRGVNAAADAIARLQGAAIPASILERDVLASRALDARQHMDRMFTSGELVWVGREPLGSRDGKVAVYLRESFATLWEPPAAAVEPGPAGESILEYLRDRGASFFRDIYEGVGGGDIGDLTDALWDLVWSGLVTNDSFEPVRHFMARRGGVARGRNIARFPAHTSGRWSLVESLMGATRPAHTESRTAWAHLLLDRHGVVTRSTVLAEGQPGGFAGLYPVFSRLEETGRVRRGYFVEGLGGSQFALPGAVDRLRSPSEHGVLAIAAADPANPYGASLPWPDHHTRLARDAGAYVFIYDGWLVAFLDKGRRNLTILPPGQEVYGQIGAELAAVAARHRRLVLRTVDDEAASSSPMAPTLRDSGFAPDPKGLAFRR